jgi:hypothetical protein
VCASGTGSETVLLFFKKPELQQVLYRVKTHPTLEKTF